MTLKTGRHRLGVGTGERPTQSGISFQAGGTLREGALYVERPADHELPQALLQREFCYVLAPRQIGKSSLRVRTSHRLHQAGVRCVTIDLTTIGSRDSSAAEWYFGLLSEVADQLGLPDPGPFWEEHRRQSPVHRWSLFLRDQVLGQTEAQVVIFIDEVDALLSLKALSRDDFFASVRAVYNARADDKRYERLTFCLFGVAMASDLVQDERRTPFNIGRGIPLSDFSQYEMSAFLPGLLQAGGDAHAILDEIFQWTSGHPYMTQMVCQALLEMPPPAVAGFEAERVAAVVQQLFLRKGRVLEAGLSYAEKWFDRTDVPVRTAAMLRLYQRLRAGERVPSRSDDAVQMALRLTGLATERQEERQAGLGVFLEVRNRIFADVFDARWVRDMTAKRLVAAPLLRWVESGRRDEFLLSGRALDEAQVWARETADLTRQEAEFLEVSERATQRSRNQRLNVLFLTEIWKSTANYLLLYILLDYLEKTLGMSGQWAARINSGYFSAIYVTPLIGGYMGDRVLGYRRSVWAGILLLAIGYFVMSIPRWPATVTGFLMLLVGHGLYKPNFTALLGCVYDRQDERRVGAFLRYYLGLNIGAALGPILVTSLSGPSVMCAAAGVAMVVALLSFQHYPEQSQGQPGVAGLAGDQPFALNDPFEGFSEHDSRKMRADSAQRSGAPFTDSAQRSGAPFTDSAQRSGAPFTEPPRSSPGLSGLSGLAGGLVDVARAAARDNDNRSFRVLVLLVAVVAVPFWLTFYGAGAIAEQWLNSRAYSWLDLMFSPTTKQRLSAAQNPIFVVGMMPLVWGGLLWLRKRNQEPSTYLKMTVGMVLIAVALLILLIPDREHGSIAWLVASNCVLAVAELLVVPMSYSLVVGLAPGRMLALALGVWFVPMMLGSNAAKWVAALWARESWPLRGHLLLLAGISLGTAFVLAAQVKRVQGAGPSPGPGPGTRPVQGPAPG